MSISIACHLNLLTFNDRIKSSRFDKNILANITSSLISVITKLKILTECLISIACN